MPPCMEELILGFFLFTSVSRGMDSMPSFWFGTS